MINLNKLKIETQTSHKKDKDLDHLLIKRVLPDMSKAKSESIEDPEIPENVRNPNTSIDHVYIMNKMMEGLEKAPLKTLDIMIKFYSTPISDTLDTSEHSMMLKAVINGVNAMKDKLNKYFELLGQILCKIRQVENIDDTRVR